MKKRRGRKGRAGEAFCMTFEEAEARLSKERKAELARRMWRGEALPDGLSEEEKGFCFGLYVYEEYEQREQLRRYFEEG